MGALAHNPGDVVHRRCHSDKARADVTQRQEQNAYPLIVFPRIFQIVFQFVIGLNRRANTFAHRSEAEQEHTGADKRQNGHRHLVALGFILSAEIIHHRQQG